MKVTVLIAVYNAEAYLRECLDSLLAQTHEDWEALCVDDASTDSSLSILKEYAGRDPRFSVFHLSKNQGQAVARNTAIPHASGELICFLDSDDWFACDSLEKCVEVFMHHDDADCVLFQLVKAFPTHTSFRYENYSEGKDIPRVMDGKQAFVMSLDWTLHGVYMTRTDIQRTYLYDDTCRSYSDDNTTRIHYLTSRKVYVSDGTYYYRQNENSVSNVKDISRFNFLRANEHMQQMLCELHSSDATLNLHEGVRHNNLIGCYLFYCANRDSWSASDRKFALQEMRRIWHTIEPARLKDNIRRRFGYFHCPSWFLFRVQEEVFYALRKIMGKQSNA